MTPMPGRTLFGLLLIFSLTAIASTDPPDEERWISIPDDAAQVERTLLKEIRNRGSAVLSTPSRTAPMRRSGTGAFTVIGLPDTQNYSELYPEIFLDQTQWVLSQRYIRDIRYVNHYGDVVQHADLRSEWDNGDAAMVVLDDDDIPYGINAGNHDITANGIPGEPYIPQLYLEYFGPERFEGRPWYINASPSGMSSYQVVEGGGLQFLMLQIECDGPVRELTWAQEVLDRNRDKPVMMTTHRYLQDAEDYTADVPVVPSGRYPPIWYLIESPYSDGGIQSDDIWNWFIKRNPNIFMVNCGHFHEEYRQISTNVRGNPVHEVLADYQDDPNGGNGWLRIMRFDVAADRIDVDSYSPWLDQYRSADESTFSLDVSFDSYRSIFPVAVFQEGFNGYDGTRDTWINEDEPDRSYGDDSTRESDDDTSNSIFSDSLGQAMIRFEDLFGGELGTGPIPPDSIILDARLSIEIEDDIDNPIFSPDFFVYPILVPWEETSTWNSLGNGLSGGELGSLVGSFSGDDSPNGNSLRQLNLTELVQSWSNGTMNHGIAILPEIINGNDDGISIWTSENDNGLFRPRLEVTYLPPDDGMPEDLNDDGLVDGQDLTIVLANWGGSGLGDIDGDGVIGGKDLTSVLAAWTDGG